MTRVGPLLFEPALVIVGGLWLLAVYTMGGPAKLGLYAAYPLGILWTLGRNPLNPSGWLTFFYFLYTITYPLGMLFVGNTTGPIYGELIEIQALGLWGMTAGLWIGKALVGQPVRYSIGPVGRHVQGLHYWVLLMVFAVIAMAGMVDALGSGATSKREINDSASLLTGLSKIAFFPITVILIYRLMAVQRVSLRESVLWIALALSLFSMVSYGERDIFFRLLLILAMLYFLMNRRFRRGYYLIGLVLALVLVSGSEVIKGALLSGGMNLNKGLANGFVGMFSSEFSAASRNIAVLLETDYATIGGRTFLMDINRVFNLPIFPVDVQSGSAWYNAVYREQVGLGGSSGWGFGIVPELLVNFGRAGVLIGGIIYGVAIAFVHRVAAYNQHTLVFYLMFVTFFVYALRGDLATVLALSLKSGLVVILVSILLLRTFASSFSTLYVLDRNSGKG